MTLTLPDNDETGGAVDIDLDRIIYDLEYRNEVKSALASSNAPFPSVGATERD